MEHIKHIEINNFKSIRHAAIKECRRVNVFIGEPNVGKSNILEAVSLFSIPANARFSSYIRVENLTTLFFDGNIEDKLEVQLDNKNRFVGKLVNGGVQFERQYAADRKFFTAADFVTSLTKGIELVESFILNEEATLMTDYNKSADGRPGQLLLGNIKKYEFKNDVPVIHGSYNSLLTPFGNNIFDIISSHSGIKKSINELFKPFNLKFSFDKGTRLYSIVKNIADDFISIPYSMIADTLRRLIFFEAAILSNEESVLLFEEPEAQMFPPYISKMMLNIINDEQKNQFFITTHSPYVLNDLLEDLNYEELGIYIVSYKKETGETIVDKMTKDEMHEAYQFGYDFFLNMKNFIPVN